MKKILILFILVTAIGLHAYAQNTVTGIVRDSINNSPLVGATILIKGTTIGAISDFNGNFLLKSPPNSRLVISFIGYKTKEIIYVDKYLLTSAWSPIFGNRRSRGCWVWYPKEISSDWCDLKSNK
jgi:hypothetical protein